MQSWKVELTAKFVEIVCFGLEWRLMYLFYWDVWIGSADGSEWNQSRHRTQMIEHGCVVDHGSKNVQNSGRYALSAVAVEAAMLF